MSMQDLAALKPAAGGYRWTPAWKHADTVTADNKAFLTLDTETAPVMSRFTNSTMGLSSSGATKRSCSQPGQSEQPRPDPVSRTAPPVTMMKHRATSAISVIRR